MGVAGAYVGRAARTGMLALAGGLCVTAAWFMPWATMHFGVVSTVPPSAPVSESPYTLAAQAGGWQVAGMLLLIGFALIGVGAYTSLAHRAIPWSGDALALALAVGVLVVATWSVLGMMAVPQIIGGRAAPGVYLVPGAGAIVMLAGLVLVSAACVQAWRRA